MKCPGDGSHTTHGHHTNPYSASNLTNYKGSPDKCCAVCAWGNTDAVLEINTKMGRDEPR